MLYYMERERVAGDDSYVNIAIKEDGTQEKMFMFDDSSDFSQDEKNKLRAVVPVNGFVSNTIDYELCNFTYDSIGMHILIRRKKNDYTLLPEI